MMEILEHGNPKKLDTPKIFKCFYCGCKFTADKKNILPELNTIIHIIIASVLNAVCSLMKVQNKRRHY